MDGMSHSLFKLVKGPQKSAAQTQFKNDNKKENNNVR